MPNEEINIRLANKNDKQKILDICKNIWEGYDYIPNIIDEWLKNEHSYLFVLEYNGIITHFERLRIQSETDGWMEGLRGDPNHRGKGLAKKLSSYIINYAKNIGIKILRAGVYFKNEASVLLSIKMGFSLSCELPDRL